VVSTGPRQPTLNLPGVITRRTHVGRILLLEKYSGRIVLSTCQMEAAMINDVVLEGIVVKAWKYADDLLFRLA